MTIEELTTEPQFSRTAVMTTDHNHHTKKDNMILIIILVNEATTVQTGPKTKHERLAQELIVPPNKKNFVLIA